MSWLSLKPAAVLAPPPDPTHFCCDACKHLMLRDDLTTEQIPMAGEPWWPWLCKDVTGCRQRAQAAGIYLRSTS